MSQELKLKYYLDQKPLSNTDIENMKKSKKKFIDGEYQLVLLDDYVPFDEEFEDISFAKTSKNFYWVSLIEKAFAKVLGSYSNIVNDNNNNNEEEEDEHGDKLNIKYIKQNQLSKFLQDLSQKIFPLENMIKILFIKKFTMKDYTKQIIQKMKY